MNTLEKGVSELVAVPTKYSLDNSDNYFKIINNERDEAEQVLTLNFNYGVKGKGK